MKPFYSALCSVVLVMAACATTPRNVIGVQDITGGISIVVDASAIYKNTIGRDDFSMPDNRAIATLAGNAAAVTALATAGDRMEGEIRTQSKAEIYLIDRRSGVTLWHDVMKAHDVSPAFFADAVGKMLEKLPPRNP